MPKVPARDNLSTTPSATTGFRFRNTQSQNEAALPGQQIEAIGQQVQQEGLRRTKVELEILREANQLRVDDAINQAREEAIRLQYDPDEGYTNLKGYDALERPQGVPLSDEYSGKLEERLASIADTLGSDDQRNLFSEQSTQLLSGFREGTMRYEGAEFREYSKSVRRGTIQNRTQEIALNYRNPDAIEQAVVSISASADDLARQEGFSAAEREASSRKAVSKAHMVVIETALQKEDSRYADEYFKVNAKHMEADDILRVNSVLGEQLDTRIAVQSASKIISEQQDNIFTPDADRAFNIALGTESGGKQFGGAGSVAGPGEPTTSPAGAIGIAQVMPTTGPEAAKLAGVEWDEERFRQDPEYNRALGKAYFTKQLRDFDGSLAKAYAAYNAGPGATRKAIDEAGPGGDWLSLLPTETQNYVDKNITQFGAGKGQNARPTLLELQNKVREEVGTESPRRLRLALNEVEDQFNTMNKAIKQEQDRAVSDAMQELIANGGDYKSLDPLMRSSLPPTEVGKVMDFAKKLSKGDVETNLVLYNQLTENPENLEAMSDDEFIKLRSELSDGDFKYFSKERAKLINGDIPEAKDPGNLNTGAINAALNNRFLEMGITTKDDPAQIGSIRKFVNQAIIQNQRANGQKMSDAEVEIYIDSLFAQRGVYDKLFDTEGPVLGTQSSEIPRQTKKLIEQNFKKQGINNPTETEILEAYWRSVFFKNAKNDKGSF